VRPAEPWAGWFAQLADAGRAMTVHTQGGPLWAAVERQPFLRALYGGSPVEPAARLPDSGGAYVDEDEAAASLLRGHLECRGPSTVAALADATGLPGSLILRGLASLEQEGFAISGRFTRPDAGQEYCARRLLARIHGYTRDRRRREIEP